MRVLVTGDRHWTDAGTIWRVLSAMDIDVLIAGDATGADALAFKAAKRLGLDWERYHAEWGRYGRGAGPIRNRRMLTEGKPDLVVAFHNDLGASKGTANCVEQAKELDIPWVQVKSTGGAMTGEVRPYCCHIGCDKDAEWQIVVHSLPIHPSEGYTEACSDHVGSLLWEGEEHGVYPLASQGSQKGGEKR